MNITKEVSITREQFIAQPNHDTYANLMRALRFSTCMSYYPEGTENHAKLIIIARGTQMHRDLILLDEAISLVKSHIHSFDIPHYAPYFYSLDESKEVQDLAIEFIDDFMNLEMCEYMEAQ